MNIKKETLWYVPVFCFFAGIISSQILIWEIHFFASENLGNNGIYVYTSRFLIFWGINLFLILIAGFFIFRKIPKKDLFFSALLMAVIQFIFLFIQIASGELSNIVFFYLSGWCNFFSELTHEKLGSEFIGNVLKCLMPFIFVLFGKKASPSGVRRMSKTSHESRMHDKA